jgi:hypothetical protein
MPDIVPPEPALVNGFIEKANSAYKNGDYYDGKYYQ